MLISASRRTDIAAFYTPWLINRLRAGEVWVPRIHQPGVWEWVDLTAQAVDALVIISKNPQPLLPHLEELRQRGYQIAVQMTITGYGSSWEAHVPPLEESVAVFRKLSQLLGPEWVDWRYDPILLDKGISLAWHKQQFEALCQALSSATTRCIVSFADAYPHLGGLVQPLEEDTMRALAQMLSAIAASYQLTVTSCAERLDFSAQGIKPGACIDGERLSQLLGYQLPRVLASGQRAACRCAESIDIGSYDTCLHGCRYCYATTSTVLANRRHALHDPASPLLWGRPTGREQLVKRPAHSAVRQLKLF